MEKFESQLFKTADKLRNIKPTQNLLVNTLQKAHIAYTTDLTKAEFKVIVPL